MARPQIVVNVTSTPVRRGVDTLTGTAFMTYAGTTGPTTPLEVLSEAAALTAGVPAAIATYIGDCLRLGAPRVVVVKATAAVPATPTEAEWTTALGLFDDSWGLGQVLIPGQALSAAWNALLAHAVTSGRAVLLDGSSAGTSTDHATAATGLAAASGAERAGFLAPWVQFPQTGGGTRTVPPSVVAAALAARGDAAVGHANQAPAGDQGLSAGVVTGATGVTAVFTSAQQDTMYDAGVSIIKPVLGVPTLYGWTALSDNAVWRQLNSGRMAMELTSALQQACAKYLFRQIDGQGKLYAELEGTLRGLLIPYWEADALYGETAADAFDVDTQSVNTAATAAAGELHAQVAVTLSQHTERVVFDVAVSIAN